MTYLDAEADLSLFAFTESRRLNAASDVQANLYRRVSGWIDQGRISDAQRRRMIEGVREFLEEIDAKYKEEKSNRS